MEQRCTDCKSALILHAGGVIACQCGELWEPGGAVPQAWNASKEQLEAAAAAEQEQD